MLYSFFVLLQLLHYFYIACWHYSLLRRLLHSVYVYYRIHSEPQFAYGYELIFLALGAALLLPVDGVDVLMTEFIAYILHDCDNGIILAVEFDKGTGENVDTVQVRFYNGLKINTSNAVNFHFSQSNLEDAAI